jgi:hypothetical protein
MIGNDFSFLHLGPAGNSLVAVRSSGRIHHIPKRLRRPPDTTDCRTIRRLSNKLAKCRDTRDEKCSRLFQARSVVSKYYLIIQGGRQVCCALNNIDVLDACRASICNSFAMGLQGRSTAFRA